MGFLTHADGEKHFSLGPNFTHVHYTNRLEHNHRLFMTESKTQEMAL